jgi:sugar phosphate permease
MTGGVATEPNEKRWRILLFWWFCHALVSGSARVIFEANLPNIISNTNEYRNFKGDDVPLLLSVGTMVTIVGKFSSGPVIAALTPYGVGVASLLCCGVVIIGCGIITPISNTPLVSIFLGWNLIRFFQTATWPASNLLFDAWFPTNEHGRAWGAMSTASRIGVMIVSFAIAYLNAKTTVQMNFLGCGIALCLYGIILSLNLENEPEKREESGRAGVPSDQTIDKDAPEQRKGKRKRFWNELFDCTIFEPTFYLAALVQASTTPIAEFQSQVPIWLSMDKTLNSTDINVGVTAWHAGILVSVLIFGVFFDKVTSDVHKGLLLAAPMLCNYVLFSILLKDFETESSQDHMVAGPLMKVGVTFLLGFTVAPAFYLCMGTWTMRHSTRRVMATSNSFVDVFGYGGSVLVLYLQQSGGTEEGNPMKKLIQLFTYCSLSCAIALMVLFAFFEKNYKREKEKGKED